MQQDPILYYCTKIRGIIFDYEKSFENMKKDQAENLEARRVAFWEEQEENYIMNSSPRRNQRDLEG